MTRPPRGRTSGDAAANGSGKITREVVLAAALEIIDADGAEALSMRRLARALGRDPMILYRHAPNKAALLDGVAETVLAQLTVDPADPDWAAQLRTVARDYRALALAHPNVVPLLVTRPLATPLALRPPGTLRPLEDILALLTRAGFSGPDALHIYRALFGFLHGHVLNELQELVENPEETDDLLRLGLHRLPIGEFPLLRSLAPVLACLRRRRRTRTRPRHPPHRADRHTAPQARVTTPVAQDPPGQAIAAVQAAGRSCPVITSRAASCPAGPGMPGCRISGMAYAAEQNQSNIRIVAPDLGGSFP